MQLGYTPRRRNRVNTRQVRVATSNAIAPVPNPSILRRPYFESRVPKSENDRTTFGRSLDLDRIQSAIRNAGLGFMYPITDMGRETSALDGHLSGLLSKRFNRVVSLDWEIVAAEGRGIDEGRAEDYAEFCREQIKGIPNFKQRLLDLAWASYDARASHELEWMELGREWHVKNLHWIHPRRISFGPDREFVIVDARASSGNFQPRGFCLNNYPYKFIQFAPRLFNDYQEREGLLPRCLYWSYFQRFSTRERMVLLEMFGKPWRIVSPIPGEPFNESTAQQAFEVVNALGHYNTARMPPGFKVDVQMPSTTGSSIGIYDSATKDSREVLSKLVLGNTATTDAVPTGLGSSVGDAHLTEEDLLVWADAWRLAECIEDQLIDPIVIVNFGIDDVIHAPHFRLRTEPPLDRAKEAQRFESALKLGLTVAEEEMRQKLGIREIKEGEPVVRMVVRIAEIGQVAPPPAPEVIYPPGKVPTTGETQPMPEAGLDPMTPANQVTPQLYPPETGTVPGVAPALGDTGLTGDEAVEELCRRMTEDGVPRCEHGSSNRCRKCGIERVRDYELGPDGEPQWKIAWRPIHNKPEMPGQLPGAA